MSTINIKSDLSDLPFEIANSDEIKIMIKRCEKHNEDQPMSWERDDNRPGLRATVGGTNYIIACNDKKVSATWVGKESGFGISLKDATTQSLQVSDEVANLLGASRWEEKARETREQRAASRFADAAAELIHAGQEVNLSQIMNENSSLEPMRTDLNLIASALMQAKVLESQNGRLDRNEDSIAQFDKNANYNNKFGDARANDKTIMEAIGTGTESLIKFINEDKNFFALDEKDAGIFLRAAADLGDNASTFGFLSNPSAILDQLNSGISDEIGHDHPVFQQSQEETRMEVPYEARYEVAKAALRLLDHIKTSEFEAAGLDEYANNLAKTLSEANYLLPGESEERTLPLDEQAFRGTPDQQMAIITAANAINSWAIDNKIGEGEMIALSFSSLDAAVKKAEPQEIKIKVAMTSESILEANNGDFTSENASLLYDWFDIADATMNTANAMDGLQKVYIDREAAKDTVSINTDLKESGMLSVIEDISKGKRDSMLMEPVDANRIINMVGAIDELNISLSENTSSETREVNSRDQKSTTDLDEKKAKKSAEGKQDDSNEKLTEKVWIEVKHDQDSITVEASIVDQFHKHADSVVHSGVLSNISTIGGRDAEYIVNHSPERRAEKNANTYEDILSSDHFMPNTETAYDANRQEPFMSIAEWDKFEETRAANNKEIRRQPLIIKPGSAKESYGVRFDSMQVEATDNNDAMAVQKTNMRSWIRNTLSAESSDARKNDQSVYAKPLHKLMLRVGGAQSGQSGDALPSMTIVSPSRELSKLFMEEAGHVVDRRREENLRFQNQKQQDYDNKAEHWSVQLDKEDAKKFIDIYDASGSNKKPDLKWEGSTVVISHEDAPTIRAQVVGTPEMSRPRQVEDFDRSIHGKRITEEMPKGYTLAKLNTSSLESALLTADQSITINFKNDRVEEMLSDNEAANLQKQKHKQRDEIVL